jgi:hypothetical protein
MLMKPFAPAGVVKFRMARRDLMQQLNAIGEDQDEAGSVFELRFRKAPARYRRRAC